MRALGILALVTACNGFEAPAQPAGGAHPISNAGTGSSYPRGTVVPLDGSHSFDPDGGTLSYRWTIVQQPSGSTATPLDANAAATNFVPDQFGTYRLQLQVSDDAQHTDTSELRIVATGAITSIDAGPAGAVSWLGIAQLAGAVAIAPGQVATYSWDFVSRPAGSTASLDSAHTLTPTFVADATGTYVLALDVSVGDEVGEDTVMVEATAVGIPIATDAVAYTFSKNLDRIVYVHDVGHAEIVNVDPTTGVQIAFNIGAFTPRSLSLNEMDGVIAVGALSKVTTLSLSSFAVIRSRAVPGCTAKQVTIPFGTRVDCFPEDGNIEPISSVDMTSGVVTQIPCPVQFPDVTLNANSDMYMVDGASSQFYVYEGFATPPLSVSQHGSLAGIAPPVIAAGTNPLFALTGNGLAVNTNATLLFDLQTPVQAGSFAPLHFEIAVVSGARLKVFGAEPPQLLKLSAIIPSVGGVAPTPKLVAYSSDEHRLIIVAGTPAGDVAYTVAR